MKKIGQMIKKYGNTVLLFLAVFSASEIGNKGCMFIFHQPEIPEELKNSNISMRIKKVIRRGVQCILEIQKLQNMFSRNGG